MRFPQPHLPFAISILLIFALSSCQEGGSKADPDSGPAGGNADGAVSLADANGGFLPDAALVGIDSGPVTGDDAGLSPDAGVSDVDVVCQKACLKLALCFGVAVSDCVIECSDQVGLVCSPMEVQQIGTCADLACDAFESCVEAVPCTGGGGGGGGNFCGDGVCDAQFGESCSDCPQDCGQCVCGDGTCSTGECSTCASDCPLGCSCGDVCQLGPAQDPSCDACQATVCNADAFCCQQSWDAYCVSEAESLCGKQCPAFCGDLSCDPNETTASCPDDCDIGPSPTPVP